jgi:hypothetical protein
MELSAVAIGLRDDVLPVVEPVLHLLMRNLEQSDRDTVMGQLPAQGIRFLQPRTYRGRC